MYVCVQVLSMGSGVGMPLMMSMLGIGLPCSLPLQFLPHPQTNIANNSPQMIPGFPNHVLPNIQFPISQQSPFISMPPKPIQPYLSSHLSTFDHNSDLNASLASAAMPKVTKVCSLFSLTTLLSVLQILPIRLKLTCLNTWLYKLHVSRL